MKVKIFLPGGGEVSIKDITHHSVIDGVLTVYRARNGEGTSAVLSPMVPVAIYAKDQWKRLYYLENDGEKDV